MLYSPGVSAVYDMVTYCIVWTLVSQGVRVGRLLGSLSMAGGMWNRERVMFYEVGEIGGQVAKYGVYWKGGF